MSNLYDRNRYDSKRYDQADTVTPTPGTGSIIVPSVQLSSTGSPKITGTASFSAPHATLTGSGHVGGTTGTVTFTVPHVLLNAFTPALITGTASFTAKPIKLYAWVVNTGTVIFFARSVRLSGTNGKVTGVGTFRCRAMRLSAAGYILDVTIPTVQGTIILDGEVQTITSDLISASGDIILTGEVNPTVIGSVLTCAGDIILDGFVIAPIAAVVVPCITGDSFTSPIPPKASSWSY